MFLDEKLRQLYCESAFAPSVGVSKGWKRTRYHGGVTSFAPTTGCFGSHSRDGGDSSHAFRRKAFVGRILNTSNRDYRAIFGMILDSLVTEWPARRAAPVRTRPLSRSARADSYVSVISPTISGVKNFTYETRLPATSYAWRVSFPAWVER